MAMSLEEMEAMLQQMGQEGEAPAAPPQPMAGDPAISDAPSENPAQGGGETRKAPTSLDEMELVLQAEQAKDAPPQESGSILRGFNSSLANLIGFPVEVVNDALGMAGANFAEGGDAMKAVRGAFNKLGIKTHEPGKGDIWDRIGSETLSSVLSMIGLRAAAPTMQAAAAAPTAGPLSRAGGVLADAAMNRPINTAVGSLTAPIGAVPAAEQAGNVFEKGGEALAGGPGVVSKTARSVGEGVGATIGGIATGGAGQLGGDALANVSKWVARKGMGMVGLTPGQALQPIYRADVPMQRRGIVLEDADQTAPKYFAENAVTREVTATDAAIRREVQAIQQAASRGLSEEEVSSRLSAAMERVRDAGRAIENRLWGRVPRGAPVTQVGEIDNALSRIMPYSEVDQPQIPWRAVTQLTDSLDASRAGTRQLTVGDLLTMRSRILKEAGEASSGTLLSQPDPQLARHLNDLEQAILSTIQRAVPNDTTIQQARAYSHEFNNRFTRGPIGQVLLEGGQGMPRRTLPEDVLQAILGDRQGPRAVHAATAPINVGGRGQGRTQTLTGSGPLRTEMDAGIRAAYANDLQDVIAAADATTNPGGMARAVAKASEAQVRKLNGRIDDYARASTTLRDSQRQFLEWANERDVWTNSALAQFAQRDSAAAVANVMNSRDPARTMRDLLRGSDLPAAGNTRARMRMDSDPDVVEGLKRGVIAHIFREGQTAEPLSIGRVMNTLGNPKIKGMMNELFTTDELGRLQRIVGAANEIAGGKVNPAMRFTRFLGTGMAHILGLKFGHGLAKITNAGPQGSLSIPARAAKQARTLFLKAFATGDPAKLIAQAVMDPATERLLLMKAPSTLADLKRANAISRKLVSAAAGNRAALEQGFMSRYQTEDQEP